MSYDAEVKVTTEVTDTIMANFYRSINEGQSILSYYTSASSRYSDNPPDISINGLSGVTPAAYEAMLAEQRGGGGGGSRNPAAATNPPDPFRDNLANGLGGPSASTAGRVFYEIDAMDCQVINPDCGLGNPPSPAPAAPASMRGGGGGASAGSVGQRASIAVHVTGRVSIGHGKDAEASAQSFIEVVVLVPNWDAVGRNAPRNARRWLIISQTFRLL